MSNASDFIIENGVLTKYTGPGGDVVIPEGVTSIGMFAFSDCKSLTTVTIPDSVTSIGDSAFYYCENLSKLIVDENNLHFASNHEGVLFNKDQTELLRAPCAISGAYRIPDSVTSIGCSAFSDCYRLTAVTIPDSVTAIYAKAFSDCKSLTELAIGNGVTTIGPWAFANCRKLRSVTIGSDTVSISWEAFANCNNIARLTIPVSLGSMVSKRFEFRNKLRIDIPDIAALSAKFRICAALCFAEDGGSAEDPRYESHVKYLKANAGKIVETAVGNLPLLTLICRESCIKAKDIEAYTEAVQKTGNTEAIAMILEYQNSKLSGSQKDRAAKQKEKQADTVIDRAIARMDQEGIAGLNFVVTGDVETFNKRADLKAFIESLGAKMQSSMSSKTDYLIMNNASSNSEKAQKAKALGVEVITERKFNDMAGRAFVIVDGVLTKYQGTGGEIVIPDSVTSIGDFAFYGDKSLTIHGKAGSCAEAYAKKYNIPFVAE